MDKQTNLMEITIRDFIGALFRQKAVIIITMIVVLSSVYIGIKFNTPVYEAQVMMHIKGQSKTASVTYRGISAFRIHITQMKMVTVKPVLSRVVKALHLDQRPFGYEEKFATSLKKPFIAYKTKKINRKLDAMGEKEKADFLFNNAIDSLRKSVSTDLIPNTDIFVIKVKDFDPHNAVSIANAVSRSFTIFDLEQQLAELTIKYGYLHPSVKQLKDNIYKMTEQLSGDELPTLDALGEASVKIIEQARAGRYPIGKSNTLIFIVAIFVSFSLGISLALFFDFIDTTFKSPQDIVKQTNLPFLGSIPKKRYQVKGLISDTKKKENKFVQSYGDIADELYTFMKTQNLKVLLMISASQLPQKSDIVENIGISLSREWGLKTLLIDANLDNSSISHNFSIDEGSPGFANMIEYDRESYIHEIDSTLHVLGAGESSQKAITVLSSKKSQEIIERQKEHYEAILIDSTKLNNVKEISLFSTYVDGVILILNQGKERKQVVKNLIIPFRNKNINLIGAILNNRKFVIPQIIYNRL